MLRSKPLKIKNQSRTQHNNVHKTNTRRHSTRMNTPHRNIKSNRHILSPQHIHKAKLSTSAVPPGNFRTPRSLNKTSLMFTVANKPGALQQSLNLFANHGVNLTRLESKPCIRSDDYEFHVDFDGSLNDDNVKRLMESLTQKSHKLSVLQGKKVPWFPRFKKDLDIVANEVLDSGELEADHPGFHDQEYRARRHELTEIARNFRYGEKIPRVDYNKQEQDTWRTVLERLIPLHQKYACAETLRLWPLFEQNCGLRVDNIPQLQDISDFLYECTGWQIRPVAGLLSNRNFLYGLAFRTFFSTQYLRHHSKPLYTPEPDLTHEINHQILLADQAFADFSHEIGLASIGATDEQIDALVRCYWYTVEFGLCKEGNDIKAYGAGILSSFGELEYSMGLDPNAKPTMERFDPFIAAQRKYPITTYQPHYFVADSFDMAKQQMSDFAATLTKPFNIIYKPYTSSIDVDTNIELQEHVFIKPQGNVYEQDKLQNQKM